MINKILTSPIKCNLTAENKNIVFEDSSSTNEIIKTVQDLSIFTISEVFRTITFASIQFSNTVRSLEFFYPIFNNEITSCISTMACEIISLLNQFFKSIGLFFAENPNKKQNQAQGLNTFEVSAAIWMERSGARSFINTFNFYFKKQAVLTLAEQTRSRIGKITLRFQEKYFIQQFDTEVYDE